ncbi:MAG: DUF2846 domain-containing protein, partial [Paraglaciecola sp.]|nr:DUF2846 domain-containing protein [Paraglaciecola sp.]
MKKALFSIAIIAALATGCATVPMEQGESSKLAKQFTPPSEGKSGLYVYRKGSLGGALKKDVWINGECIGETAPDIFFYEEVDADREHQIAT